MATGGEILVRALIDRGVDTLFGLPGVQLDGLFDALAGNTGIRVIHTRHEQSTSFMADGYARASGRVGVCAVVPGPGVLNAGAGLSTAFATGSPVLLVAGNIFGGSASLGTGALHELPDQSAIIAGTIGATQPVHTVEDIAPALDAAFARLQGCPVRPAAVEIGPEVLLAPTSYTLPPPHPAPLPPQPDSTLVVRAAERLAPSTRPVIVAGGGALAAGEALYALAAALGAPIVLTPEGKGAVSANHPHVLPPLAGFPLLDEADAIVTVGTRYHTVPGLGGVQHEATVVRIDADAERLASTPTRTPASVDLRADAEPGAVALAAALANVRVPDDERDERHRTRVAEVRATVLQGLAERFPETWAYCRALREVIPEDGILVDEMTQVGYMARNAYPVSQPGTLIGSGYQGTLGFGYSTALGAKVGCPDKPVVSINGDGGFMYGAAELATAVQHGINVVAAVFTDGAYGNVKRIQRLSYGREIASTLHNPDFVRLAESFGVPATRVSDPEAFGPALAEALEAGEPRLIDVSIGEQPEIWGLFMGRERF